MRLAISRGAAPGMDLGELAELARRRGLDGIEILARDVEDVARAKLEPRVAALYVESPWDATTARAAAALGAPVVAARGAVSASAIAALDVLYAREGATLCVTHGSDPEEAAELVSAMAHAGVTNVRTAWEVRPVVEDLAGAATLLLVTADTLGYVRLRGGGPELAAQYGAGIGSVVSALALSAYDGNVALAPSAVEHTASWGRWLASTSKTGCGSARPSRSDMELDMRPVEPRDRLETIHSAYRALSPGRTLHLTLDHDPSCMYYTLEATEPHGSFGFARVEDGPEVWRVAVLKRAH